MIQSIDKGRAMLLALGLRRSVGAGIVIYNEDRRSLRRLAEAEGARHAHLSACSGSQAASQFSG